MGEGSLVGIIEKGARWARTNYQNVQLEREICRTRFFTKTLLGSKSTTGRWKSLRVETKRNWFQVVTEQSCQRHSLVGYLYLLSVCWSGTLYSQVESERGNDVFSATLGQYLRVQCSRSRFVAAVATADHLAVVAYHRPQPHTNFRDTLIGTAFQTTSENTFRRVRKSWQFLVALPSSGAEDLAFLVSIS